MSDPTLIELLYGEGAHANTLACVEDVPLAVAGRQSDYYPHSIWQLVCHMNFWMEYELKRIRHESSPYPEHASKSWPVDAAPGSEEEWRATIARFRNLLAELATLAGSPPDVLSEQISQTHPDHAKRSSSLRAVLWQTLVHNSYHIGQVATMRRAFGVWPPSTGGDTW